MGWSDRSRELEELIEIEHDAASTFSVPHLKGRSRHCHVGHLWSKWPMRSEWLSQGGKGAYKSDPLSHIEAISCSVVLAIESTTSIVAYVEAAGPQCFMDLPRVQPSVSVLVTLPFGKGLRSLVTGPPSGMMTHTHHREDLLHAEQEFVQRDIFPEVDLAIAVHIKYPDQLR